MKLTKAIVSLVLGSSILVACGGGGNSRSPDRLGTQVDPSSAYINFPNGNQLQATGNSSIPVRMLATQTDGIDTGLGPVQNITDNTSWELTAFNGGSLNIAALAAAVRDAGGLGNVLDILSTVRLTSDDSNVQAKIIGTYRGVTRVGDFTLIAPVALGAPFISGPTTIAIDSTDPTDTATGSYQLLQQLQGSSIPENKTSQVRFCVVEDSIATVAQPQPAASGSAQITFTNPFDATSTEPAFVTVFAIDPDFQCGERFDGNTDRAIDLQTITLLPAVVSNVDICAVTNPAADVCGLDGISFNEDYLSSCRGAGATSISVPAAQSIQMVAALQYTNPAISNDPLGTIYTCSSAGNLTWSSAPNAVFDGGNGPDATDGDATLVDRNTFDALAVGDRFSVVQGSYDNGTQNITDTLRLNVVSTEIDGFEIVRTQGAADEITLGIFGGSLEYEARCSFVQFGATEDPIPCGDAFVVWSLDRDDLIAANPLQADTTTVTGLEDAAQDGIVKLTATFTDSSGNVLTDSVDINVINDQLVELHLLQISDTDTNIRQVDSFSCLGRDDLVGTLEAGENYVPGAHYYFAHALFATQQDAYNGDPATLFDLTDFDSVQFSAISGYSDGAGGCVTSADPTGNLPTDQIPEDFSSGPAASFSADPKGELMPNGLLRLNTVCVRAFVDSDGDGMLSDGDVVSEESSTVLVLPAANDNLLTQTNDLCETLEPVLTLGAGNDPIQAGIIVPLVYALATVADPILLQLDEPLTEPVLDELLTGLLTGDFSGLAPDEYPGPTMAPAGLGTITNTLLGDEALGPLVDAIDACLTYPTTQAVYTVLNALLSGSPESIQDLADTDTEACTALFDDFGGGDLGGGDLGGDLGGDNPLDPLLGPLMDLLSGGGDLPFEPPF